MTDERQIEQQELGDLDVCEEEAEEVKGGGFAKAVDRDGQLTGIKDGTSNTLGVQSVVTEKLSATHY
jgi:hypothetical protein